MCSLQAVFSKDCFWRKTLHSVTPLYNQSGLWLCVVVSSWSLINNSKISFGCDSWVYSADRYDRSEATGGRYCSRRNQEEEEEQEEELGVVEEDGQEMESEEAAETRKRQFLLFLQLFLHNNMSVTPANVSHVCLKVWIRLLKMLVHLWSRLWHQVSKRSVCLNVMLTV